MEEIRFFQYLAGPRRGELVVFDRVEADDGTAYVCFKDGSRVNEELIAPLNKHFITREIMAEVDGPGNMWGFKEKEDESTKVRREKDAQTGEVFEIPSADDVAKADLTGSTGVTTPRQLKKIIELIPPRMSNPKASKFGQINQPTAPALVPNGNYVTQQITQPTQSVAPQPQISTDPVHLMCKSAKKFDTEINMTLRIALPKKSFYNVAKESFEDGGNKVVEYIIQHLDHKQIEDALRRSLLEAYEDLPQELNTASGSGLYSPEVVEEPKIGAPVMAESIPEEKEDQEEK